MLAFNSSSLPIRILRKIFIFCLIVLILVALWVRVGIQPVDANGKEKIVIIPTNSTTSEIAEILTEEGIIRNEFLFKMYAKQLGLDRSFKAGEYILSPSYSMIEVAEKLANGDVNFVTFTIPEGYTTEQIIEVLEKKGLIEKEKFIAELKNGQFDFPYIEQLPEGDKRFEGFLFPDTYRVPSSYNEHQIIQLMLDRFLEVYDSNLHQKAQASGFTTYKIITLASIIEREVKVPEERKIVSAVFHNRLKMGMPLQSCATIQYILGEPKEVLLNEDIQIESPYNTYLNKGLPYGPISNPGRESIEAAVAPENVDYIYFVSKGNGTHHFSTTLEEHNKAKQKYLKK